MVRLQDRRGGTGEILNVLRVNNDNFCDLAALTVLNDRCKPSYIVISDLVAKEGQALVLIASRGHSTGQVHGQGQGCIVQPKVKVTRMPLSWACPSWKR